ncbi:RNA-binding protein [Pikeienuella piscinae]|uniref:RNA-binding protein n=1 Tax=Pikeienuella piscinae TaxID=2748098 RepID=A0A7L5BWB0_9RHOB|nr:RNA-binding protein [Pikeienuella piscinae]QIE54164.1 RNA-binding protein [Pikeienuella piscinae]
MPKGPQGQKRPADVIGNAVLIAKIATGEIEDTTLAAPGRRKSGLAGGKARAESLSAEQRSEIARKAASARWG